MHDLGPERNRRLFAYYAQQARQRGTSDRAVYLYDRRSGRSRRIMSPRGRRATFVSADHRTLLAETVRSTYPPHEHDRFIAHFRGLIDLWRRDTIS